MPVPEARLDRARDPVHVGDGFDRVGAHGRLAGEHQGRGAVEHGVRDVARLGPSGLRMVDHRLEHLRRRDHRLPFLKRREDDPFLKERNRRGARLHSKIAARNHDRIGHVDDLVEDRYGLCLLDLRDHLRVRSGVGDQAAQLTYVGGGPHERECDEVNAE